MSILDVIRVTVVSLILWGLIIWAVVAIVQAAS